MRMAAESIYTDWFHAVPLPAVDVRTIRGSSDFDYQGETMTAIHN